MRYLRWVLIILLVTLAAWKLYPHFTDFSKIYALKNNINYYFLTIGILAQAGQYIGDGWLSQTLLKIVGVEMKFKNAIKIASLNVLAAHLFPVGEAGSIATAYYFYKKLGVGTKSFIFLSMCWSTITFSTLVLMFLISLFFIPHLPYINFNLIALVIIAILVIIPVLLVLARHFIWKKFKDRLQKLAIFKELLEFKDSFHHYRRAIFAHKFFLLQAIAAAFLYYGTNVITLSFAFLTFGQTPPVAIVIFAYALSMISGWITLSPAGLGASEATLIIIFLQFGLDPAKSIGAVLVFRLISFWIPIPAGALSYISLKRNLKTDEKPPNITP